MCGARIAVLSTPQACAVVAMAIQPSQSAAFAPACAEAHEGGGRARLRSTLRTSCYVMFHYVTFVMLRYVME